MFSSNNVYIFTLKLQDRYHCFLDTLYFCQPFLTIWYCVNRCTTKHPFPIWWFDDNLGITRWNLVFTSLICGRDLLTINLVCPHCRNSPRMLKTLSAPWNLKLYGKKLIWLMYVAGYVGVEISRSLRHSGTFCPGKCDLFDISCMPNKKTNSQSWWIMIILPYCWVPYVLFIFYLELR